jgi:DNA ligase 1
MRAFARLYDELDASTATGDKVAALVRYLQGSAASAPADAAWAVYFLCGGKPRQVVPTALLRATVCRMAGVDDWLFEECYQAVGDLAETIAHLLPPGASRVDEGLAWWVQERLLPLKGLSPAEQATQLEAVLLPLDASERFLFIKLIGGGFRVGVSKLLVQRAIAQWSGLDPKLMAQRLVGWTDAQQTPSAERWRALVAPADPQGHAASVGGQPYPFFLAHALQDDPATLADVGEWLVEWKYDGIRAQIVKRQGQVWIWSRGEELVSERFPEVLSAAAALPEGTVLDGELLVWHEGSEQPAPFQLLQQRIGRKTLSKKLLAQAPVVFVAYDLLEAQGADQRSRPQHQRRLALEQLLQGHAGLRLSPLVGVSSWAEAAAQRQTARERGVEGFMLKHRDSRYGTGRTKSDGSWWKWKVDPLSVDAVLIYAQAGHGRRASVYTDYTFAVWSRPPLHAAEAQAVLDAIERRAKPEPGALQLLPFAKAYSGLTDEEFKAVDRVIRATTLEKFGPVRSVKPSLLFEIGFEGIQKSPRHKSGFAVRFPRMLRLREDKPLWQADTLQTLQQLIAPNPGEGLSSLSGN